MTFVRPTDGRWRFALRGTSDWTSTGPTANPSTNFTLSARPELAEGCQRGNKFYPEIVEEQQINTPPTTNLKNKYRIPSVRVQWYDYSNAG